MLQVGPHECEAGEFGPEGRAMPTADEMPLPLWPTGGLPASGPELPPDDEEAGAPERFEEGGDGVIGGGSSSSAAPQSMVEVRSSPTAFSGTAATAPPLSVGARATPLAPIVEAAAESDTLSPLSPTSSSQLAMAAGTAATVAAAMPTDPIPPLARTLFIGTDTCDTIIRGLVHQHVMAVPGIQQVKLTLPEVGGMPALRGTGLLFYELPHVVPPLAFILPGPCGPDPAPGDSVSGSAG